ncbi:MAG: hypothetical protein WKF71_14780 [Pyrinomonadaceae bacterium]
MTPKFTDLDRKLVLEELERIQNVKLEQVKPSRKLYRDSNRMFYLISGGAEDWHGINANIMQNLAAHNQEGAFVVVKKYKTKMDVCVGSLVTFLQNKDKLLTTKQGGFQFHCVLTEDGLYLDEIPELYCNKVTEILFPNYQKDLSKLKEISKIINIEIKDDVELTHYDLQAKLVLVGGYLGYRTFVPAPDKGRMTIYGNLGGLCTEQEIPEGSIPGLSLNTVKFVDVIWFDEEGYPTHAFEVEHTTDITKGLLRLYQVHKLRIKMFIISEEINKGKFQREVSKSPFAKIKNEFVFKNYDELDEFFQSVKHFSQMQVRFLASNG